jgi:NAD-dependent DNA ligase
MEVFVWRSFSCNNSSDFRLVARFADPKKADAAAKELTAFFATHAKEWDAYCGANDYDIPSKPLAAQEALAKKHGFTWPKSDILSWGDEGLVGDEPKVRVMGDVLAVYHTYCGGYGKGLPAYLTKLGAKVEKEAQDAPTLTVSFGLPGGKPGEKLAAGLAAFFAQAETEEYLSDWKSDAIGKIKLPSGTADDAAWASDGTKVEMILPIELTQIDGLKSFLTKSGVTNLTMKLCEYGDLKRIKAAAKKAAAPAKKDAAPKKAAAAALPTVGKKFLFTGKMVALSRADGQRRVKELGGVVAGSVSKDLDYLVIGDDGSPLFGAGVKGEKVLAAEKLIAKGATLKIISENEFLSLARR